MTTLRPNLPATRVPPALAAAVDSVLTRRIRLPAPPPGRGADCFAPATKIASVAALASLVAALASLVAALSGCDLAPAMVVTGAQAPDVVFYNGKIFTANEAGDFVEAVAVLDEKIVAVGTTREIRAQASEATRQVDLQGRTMLPGFCDNHVHLGRGGGGFQEWKGGLISDVPDWIRGVETMDALHDAIRNEVARLAPGEWLRGSLSREIWPNRSLPTRWDLDEGTTEHPVLLTRGPHTTVLNSRALELAGITSATEWPGGGEVGKNAEGEPDGRLYDAARRLVADVAPSGRSGPVDDETAIENMRRTLLDFASAGVSSVNIAGIRPEDFAVVQALYDRYGEELPRVTMQVRLSPGFDTYDDLERGVRESIAEMEAIGFVTGFGNDRLKLGAIKMSIDGGLSAPVFWSLEPYENRPDFSGVIRIPAEAFYPVARRAHELGWQLGIHTMGDGAVKMVVDQLERILTELPRDDHRHYLHHVAVKPPPETIEKMARLGIGVASQPAFTVGLGSFAVEALAGEREATMNPTKSLIDAGVWVSWGSDGAPYGPRVSLWTGITRKGWDDAVYGPGEAVDREEAVRLHTWAPAYQTFDEDVKGTIGVGKLADFVILGEDLFTMNEDRIRYVPIVQTVVGGKAIYTAPEAMAAG